MAPVLSHLGVNALFLEPRIGGIGTYVRRLLPELAAARPDLRISVFVNAMGRELLAAESWSSAIELVTPRLLGVRGTRALTETFALGSLADRRGVDVLHSVAMTAPLRSRAARVLTVPDVIWMLHPEPAERATARLWRAVVPAAARRSARVIVHSRSMGAEVARLLKVDERRMDVIPHGCDPVADREAPDAGDLRRRLRLGDGPLVLAVSAAKAHKNVDLLIRAMPKIRQEQPGTVLVVPGNPTARHRQLKRLAQELGIANAVAFPGWVSEIDLEGLYRHAACFAFPSLLEGFGLPVLEAMVRGLPVACARASSIPEVAGEAGVYFDPHDPGDAARALLELLEDPQTAAALGELGRKRARLFTWRRAAELHLESYQAAIAGDGQAPVRTDGVRQGSASHNSAGTARISSRSTT